MNKYFWKAGLAGALLLVGLAGLYQWRSGFQTLDQASESSQNQWLLESDLYLSKIQPIFNARCVACHACYNSPCQLDLTSYEGLRRGAHKLETYDFPLIKEHPPMRLGIDGKTTADWRKLGFFPVVSEGTGILERDSILWNLINLRKKGFLTQSERWDSASSRFCPNPRQLPKGEAVRRFPTELEQYESEHPYRGMPYGLPPLKENEIATIGQWLQSGAPGPNSQVLAAQAAADSEHVPWIQQFEGFFNATDFKSRLTARYIYEHLFLAHIYFDEKPGSFYRLVRARNLTGEADEIARVRPFDDPGEKFFYRFKKYTATLAHKNHIPYPLNLRKLEIWKKRFLLSQWNPSGQVWPPYGKEGANPFVTFMPIPVEARYRFLLDDAHYHVMTFIKGPVCNGAVAVSVINDHFWVLFMDPEKDVTVTDPRFFEQNAHLMALPANFPENEYHLDQIRSQHSQVNQSKYEFYRKNMPQGLDLNSLWDGEGVNSSALLTVYRHHDSATVLRGAKGQVPKTIWVLDYPIFEDIYYNLVAGYNVYGPILHQVTTRLHMDLSRINAQDLFLSFLPEEKRHFYRDQWTQKAPAKELKLDVLFSKVQEKALGKKIADLKPYAGVGWSSRVRYQSKDEKEEFLKEVFSERLNSQVRGPVDSIHCCGPVMPNQLPSQVEAFRDAEVWFSTVSGRAAAFAVPFPDASYVRVTLENGETRAYSLIHNKEHYNVSFLFFEDARRNTSKDSLNFIHGFGASYPNMYFDLKASEVPEFVQALQRVRDEQSWKKFLRRYGVLRSSEKFWEFHDWLYQTFKSADPIEGAQLDLNRYLGEQ